MKQCIHFPRCGGCSYLNIPYDSQLATKQRMIITLFPQVSGSILPVIPSPEIFFYRHKVQLPFGYKGQGRNGKPLLGCYAHDSHTVIDQHRCLIQDRDLSTVAWTIREWVQRTGLSIYNEYTRQGVLRHVLLRRGGGTGEILIGLVTSEQRFNGTRQLSRLLLSMIEKCSLINSNIIGIVQNVNSRDTNVVLGTEEHIWWGRPYIKEMVGTLRYKIGLSTFFQVNPYQIPQLYNEILRHIPSGAKVLDLYCGVGSIALWIAASCEQVTGIEENRDAVHAARIAAKLNNCTNTTFISSDVEDEIDRFTADDYSCAIIDPPRKGMSERFARALAVSSLKRIVYVSCNPQSLKRDAGILASDFQLTSLQAVDMFPHTEHIECVAVFKRR